MFDSIPPPLVGIMIGLGVILIVGLIMAIGGFISQFSDGPHGWE